MALGPRVWQTRSWLAQRRRLVRRMLDLLAFMLSILRAESEPTGGFNSCSQPPCLPLSRDCGTHRSLSDLS